MPRFLESSSPSALEVGRQKLMRTVQKRWESSPIREREGGIGEVTHSIVLMRHHLITLLQMLELFVVLKGSWTWKKKKRLQLWGFE